MSIYIPLPPASGGGGGGGVTSVNGYVGIVSLSSTDVGLGAVTNTSQMPLSYLDTDVALVANSNTRVASQRAIKIYTDAFVTGPSDTFTGYNSAGILDNITGWSISSINGANVNTTVNPNGAAVYTSIHSFQTNVIPTVNAPTRTYALNSLNFDIDPTNTGLNIGTAGEAAVVQTRSIRHVGTSSTGSLVAESNNFEVGNGTNPINVGGLAYSFGFGLIRTGVTVTGYVQGHGFQPNFEIGSIMGPTAYVNAFYDFATFRNTVFGNYSSFTASPTITTIANNSNYVGYACFPNITTFLGNSNFYGTNITPTIGTMNNSFFGQNINPTITSCANATGLYVNMNGVTATGQKRAADFIGDVNIQGDLGFSGGLSVGRISAFFLTNPVNGGGTPASAHTLITGLTALAGTTTANADTIGTNTAMIMVMEANATVTSGPLEIGFSALALPCVVTTHTGSNLDYANAAAYVVSLDAASTGGMIQNIRLCRGTVLPNGITQVNDLKCFFFDLPFGPVATETWGVYIEPDYAENFMAGSLKIGGTDQVANSSTALEIESTTKAFLNARMTTAQRNALTAINGHQIYNTTTDKLQVYAAGVWVDLH